MQKKAISHVFTADFSKRLACLFSIPMCCIMAKAYEGKKAGKSVKKRLKNTKKLLFSRFNVQTFVHRKVW